MTSEEHEERLKQLDVGSVIYDRFTQTHLIIYDRIGTDFRALAWSFDFNAYHESMLVQMWELLTYPASIEIIAL